MNEQRLTSRRAIQLLVLFAVSLSLLSLPGSMGGLVLPSIHSASGKLATVAANPSWLPAGPSTSTYLASIFTSPSTELTSGLLANTIDFGDWPVVPADVASLQGSGQSYYLTIPQGDHFYREVEFNLANNFWGCNMSFGNSACGTLIRQAWAHLVDKGSFVTTGPCVNHCVSLDNPIPQPIDPNTPISCSWDNTYPGSLSNSNCVVSANSGAGGVAFNCVTSGATCPTGTASGSCLGSTCYRPWMRGDGTADFCAAANLLKQAIAPTVTLNANCTFASVPAAFTTNPINFYVRQDPGRNDMGIGMSMTLCAIVMQSYVEGCTTTGGPNVVSSTTTFPAGSVLTVMVGPITTFPGFTTCVTKGSTCAPLNNWGMYTAGFQTGSAYDVMAVGYDSQFVSAPTGNTPNPCAATTSTSAAGDYQYICSQLFDAYATQITAAPCSTPTVGANPVSGQHLNAAPAVSFGACTTNGNYAISAGTVVTGATLPSAINVPITVTSVGNYAGGTISFTTSVSGPVLPAVTATTPANVALAAANPAGGVPDAYTSSVTTITVPVASTTGTDTVTITASDGTTTNSIAITVIVTTTALVTSAPATRLAAPTAQYILQDVYGKGAYTIPVFSGISSIAYVAPQSVGGSNTACATTGSSCDTQGWLRVSNAKTANVDQFFNWINAWNACPVGGGVPCAPGSVERQGNSQSTTSLSPYIASTVWDFYILGNVYDSIYASNPYAGTQVFDWMTISHTFQSNGQLSYTPPAGTTVTLHNTLKHDDFWQDGPQVTAFDVAFTYNTLIKNGAFQASGLSAIISGITVLSKFQFDINLFAQGPFTELDLGALTVMPGHLWSSCASTWSSFISTQTLPLVVSPGSGSCMDGSLTGRSFDPMANGLVIGSGAFECQNTGANGAVAVGTLGSGCSNTNTQSPTVSFTLTRFGCSLTSSGTTCVPSASAPTLLYNHAASDLALYIWSGMTGNAVSDFNNLSTAISCEGAPVPTGPCAQWQQGIGNPNADGVTSGVVGLAQDAIFRRYYTVDWVSPVAFPPSSGTMANIDVFPPVLYEGANTLSPAPVTGHACTTLGSTFNSGAGYNC